MGKSKDSEKRLVRRYDQVATKIGLSCQGCPDNCCNSYFQHHTCIEWTYLWDGIRSCSAERQQEYVNRARDYIEESRLPLAQGLRPTIMCPLNDGGFCGLYEHRLMICRMHGVPNTFVRPDGKKMSFPGCFRCQEFCSQLKEVPVLDRTSFYKDLVALEMAYVAPKGKALPKVNLTLAEMIVRGPPEL
ncbi:MAG: hypothetical protein JRI70_06635 [Deltaproteobacteria bacterium]|nr:hypothetical protein [Deltaproteobacteria bacterium]